MPGFLNPNRALEGVQQVEPLPPYTAKDEATPSQQTIKEKEEMVEVLDSEDNFEVFNQPQSPEGPTGDFDDLPPAQASHTQEALSIPNAMVLQRKMRTSLFDLLESHTGVNMPEKAIQAKLPTLPSTQVSQTNPTDKKRK